jgi:hypothetical protein
MSAYDPKRTFIGGDWISRPGQSDRMDRQDLIFAIHPGILLFRWFNTRNLVLTVQDFDLRLIHAHQHVERCLRRGQPV